MLVAQPRWGTVSFFASGTIMDARYVRWDNPAIAMDASTSIESKRVEYAPQQTWRAGFTYKVAGFSASAQWSFVDAVFTDAANAELPASNAQAGRIDSYNLWDISLKYEINKSFFLQTAINNVLDTRYATRRSGGYPGPGLLPGTGRTMTLTLGMNL
jgi:Fe(3+) dicitrate transport protein